MRIATPGGNGGVLLTDAERCDLRRYVEIHGFRASVKLLSVGAITLRGLLDGERVKASTRDRIMAAVRGGAQ